MRPHFSLSLYYRKVRNGRGYSSRLILRNRGYLLFTFSNSNNFTDFCVSSCRNKSGVSFARREKKEHGYFALRFYVHRCYTRRVKCEYNTSLIASRCYIEYKIDASTHTRCATNVINIIAFLGARIAIFHRAEVAVDAPIRTGRISRRRL